jgi:hypothetical protein
METAVRYGEDESCLAVKLVFGHISYLLGKCDAIFAPAYSGLQPDRYSCPKFLGVPDIAKSIFSEEIKFLLCEVDDGEFEPGMQQLARTFTRDWLRMKRAISRALESRTEHKRRLHATYREQLASEKPKILVVGHNYVIHDSYANLDLLAKLEERDVEAITIERVPPAPRESFLKWDFAYETIGQLQEVLPRDIVSVIVPPYADCLGAIGAAFLALDNHPAHTQFKGFGLAEFDYQIKSFTCQDCENRCEITQIMQSGDPIASSGSRCGKLNF